MQLGEGDLAGELSGHRAKDSPRPTHSASAGGRPPEGDRRWPRPVDTPEAAIGADEYQPARSYHPPMVGRASSPTFVGRTAELARLAEVVAGGRERARLVVVAGDGGIGKTRFVSQFLARSDPTERRILAGGCIALSGGGLPYAPLVEALRTFVNDTDPGDVERLIGSARSDLARLVPDLDPGAALPVESDRAGRTDQGRLFERVFGMLARMSVERPTVLAIEDVQWADDATRDLLMYLGRNLGTEPVTLIFTLRTDDPGATRVQPWVSELVHHMRGERIDLEPLTQAEARVLADELAGPDAAPSAVASVARRSGGNPLFVEELAALSAGASEDRGPGRRASEVAGDLSPTLQETIGARMRDLPEGAMHVVRALAIAGREVDERLLGEVTRMSDPILRKSIRSAVDARVVVIDRAAGRLSLRHVLLAEVVLAGLLAGERRELHHDLASALTALPALGDPNPASATAELAHHWWAAERPVAAFTAALAAADAARTVFAHGEAFQHLRRALDIFDRVPAAVRTPPIDRMGLILAAEEAADLAGETSEAEALIREGLAAADVDSEPTVAGILHSRLAYHRWLAGHADDALREHRLAVDLVPPEPPSVARARVLRGLGGALMGDGHYRESIAVCEAAIVAARAADAPVEEGRALDMLGMDRVGIGDIAGGIEALEAACTIARIHDPINGLIAGLHNLAFHLFLADRLDDALAAALEGVEIAHRSGVDRRYGGNLRAVAADVLLRLGRTTEAAALMEEARALDRAGHGTLYVLIDRIRVDVARGQLESAGAIATEADRQATDDVDFDLLAYLRTAEAERAAWTGEHAAGLAAVDEGLRALEGRDDLFLTAPLIAVGLRLTADRNEAARRLGRGTPVAGEGVTAAADRIAGRLAHYARIREEAPETLTDGLTATIAWAEAERARTNGRSDALTWRLVATGWDRLTRPVDAAYARWRAAEAALNARHDSEGAGADLRAALGSAGPNGHLPLVVAIRTLAARARIDLDGALSGGAGATPGDSVGSGDPLGGLGLSAREADVLALVAAGRTNAEIGQALSIAPKTAAGHVRRVMARLGVASRVEAAAAAAQRGLVDGPSTVPEIIDGKTPVVARTFVFTDIVGSTALIERAGDEAWVETRRWHDNALRRLFAAHGGIEIDHAGDGFFVAFPTAGPAFGCAVAIQRALAAHRRSSGFAPDVRIAAHRGDARRAGRAYTGREVHLAARLLAHAQAGEIVATATTLRAAGIRSARPVTVVSLAGIGEPIEIGWVSWR